MVAHDPPTDIDPEARRLIRCKVRKLIRLRCIHAQDRHDVEQDLVVHLQDRQRRFDPQRGDWSAFVQRVLTHCVANLLRRRYAAKRDPRRLRSLRGGIDCIPDPKQDPEDRDRELDMAEALAQLPPEGRDLAQRLLEEVSLSEVAQQRRVPRTTLQTEKRRLLLRLAQSGLRGYL